VTEEDQGYLYVNVELPAAASLQRTDEVCRSIEEVLRDTPGVRTYNTIVGYSLLSQSSASYSAFFFVSLKPWGERKTSDTSMNGILAALNRRFQSIPAANIAAFGPPAIQGLGTGRGFDFMLQDRSGGHTPRELGEQTTRFIEAARKRPEIGRIMTTFRADVPQIFVKVDRDKVLREGVDIRDVYATLQAFMGSAYINQFNRFGRQWRVFMAAAPEYRVTAKQIDRFWVRSKQGVMVPLASFVSVENTSGPQFTTRFNLFRSAEITGEPAPGYSSGDALNALEDVARQVLSREMGYDWADLSYQEKKAAGRAGAIFALSLGFVFLILAALYESWSLPFSVLLSVPIAVAGAFLGIYLRGFSLDVFGQIGLVMLIGLAAKNAILIVEFAKAGYERGEPLVDAALEGARLRLRPILMTSFAFILGCVPLWLAKGAGASGRQILGTAVISGMLAATGIAIFIIPVLFVVIERLAGGKAHAPEGARGEVG
jgi:HAE1 family hydrophobic/amphiphilic exporter-1